MGWSQINDKIYFSGTKHMTSPLLSVFDIPTACSLNVHFWTYLKQLYSVFNFAVGEYLRNYR